MVNAIKVEKIVVGSAVTGGTNIGKDALKTSEGVHNTLINSMSTGIVSQYTVAENTDTTIDISAFKAEFSPNNHSDGVALLPTEVDYAGAVGIIISDVLTNSYTYVGFLSNNTLTQKNTPFTPTEKKTIAPVCVVFHPASAIVAVSPLAIFPTNIHSQLDDTQRTINLTGNRFKKGTGNLKLTKEIGTSFMMGVVSSDLLDSNRVSSAESIDTNIFYSYKEATEGDGYKIDASVTDVDFTTYDDGSNTPAPLTDTQVAIQRGYFSPELGITVLEKGQTIYADLSDAMDNIDETHVPNPTLDQSQLRFYLLGQADATTINDAVFYHPEDIAFKRESSNRLDRSQSIKASVTATFDPNKAKFLVVAMDANMANLTISKDPIVDGTEIVIQIEWDGTIGRTFSLDASKFQGGLDIGTPDATGVINTINYVNCYWSVAKGKYNIVGNTRKYP